MKPLVLLLCCLAFGVAQARDALVAKRFMVAAAHPLAAEAGYEVLKRGGSAVDAAIAVQMVLGLVEPESSGIGGGAFMLHWSAGEKKLRTYDGRETAPAAAKPDRFLNSEKKPLSFIDAAVGGRSVGVPGVIRMLELAHQRHGRLPWPELFGAALRIADQGFEASPKLREALEGERFLREDPAARKLYYSGTRVVNREYAETLRAIARGGASVFYEGDIAKDMVLAVRTHAKPGDLTEADIRSYRAVEREAVCGPYRRWRVCSMGPPSSGGVAVLQMLGLLERTSFARAPPQSVPALHLFAEAGKLAYADRARYLGDPAFVSVPVKALLSADYLGKRAKLIGERAMPLAPPGDAEAGTSHFSIVDARGDIVSMTTTIESAFGSRIMVRGFLLNNQLTDFDFAPGGANSVAAGKRPRSSMAPTLVFENENQVRFAVGSPGGSMIINYVAKALVGTLDWGLDIQAAIELPNFGSRNGPTLIEQGSRYEQSASLLMERGHQVDRIPLTSGLHGIERVPGGWRGGADPRREGAVRGSEMKARKVSLGKTTRPNVAGVLPRKRLFGLLSKNNPVAWVTGPPGCGKTTLAASWLDHAGVASLWYQLDEGDADVATFFYYLSLAAAALEGEHQRLPLLTPEHQPGLAVFTRRYFERLYAQLKAPFAVVFDGYHAVPASSQLHEVMRVALETLPPGGRVLVISRGDPPATLTRLRANQALSVIGWEELRLTREETGAIAARRRPGFTTEAVDALYARTQGWAAGLVLMLEQGKVSDPPGSSSRQLVFDYLAGEIFQKSDARTQQLLLHTAYLPEMTTAMARALAGDEGTAELLAGLTRNNYFVAVRDTQPEPVYQYHPMLRDFLQARAADSLSKERRRELQRASAAQMEQAGRIEDAVALYRECHDWGEMARLIEAHAAVLLDQGRGETIARWVEELPAEMQAKRPWTIYWAASSQAQLAPREGRILYERAFELFRAQADSVGMVLAASGAMFAILYELDDCSLLDRWITVLDEAEKDGPLPLTREAEARVACSMLFSLTLRQPQRRDIKRWIERALAASAGQPDINLRMFVGLLASLTLMWTGLFSRAAELIAAMRQAAGASGVSPFSLITLKNIETMHAMLTADGAACEKAMREGLEIAHATGVHTWTFQLLVYGYGGALGAGNLAQAQAIARELAARTATAGRFNLCLYHHFQAWEAMLRKDLMTALQEEKAALRTAIEVGCPLFEVLCRLALAEILADCGDERKCVAHLQTLRGIVEDIDNRHLEFSCLLGFAQIALAHGRQRTGLTALRRGLQLGREYGYAHFLWWRPAAVARVLAEALAAGIEPDYARSLIKRRALVPEQPPLAVEGWPWTYRVQTFGGFRLLRHDQPLGAGNGKAKKRPLELLKLLIAYGGEQVSESRVTDALWPRIDGDSAHRSFTSTLHRLRKLLGEDRAVTLHEGRLSLDRRYFWLDTWAFEQLASDLESADGEQIEKLVERLLALYRGGFMADDADAAWMIQARERLRSRFARVLARVCRQWQESGEEARASALVEKCLEIDPLAEFKPSVSDR